MKQISITEKEYELFQKLRKIVLHSNPDKYEGIYFICGETGEHDDMGLPEYIQVCPAIGLDGMAMYKKHTDYTAPGW